MNDLQDLVEVKPINLDEVEERPLPPLPFPSKSVKNRAAMTSLLSKDSTKMADTYQAILAENQQGVDTTRQSIMQDAIAAEKPKSIGTIMSILADQSIPFEKKQQAIQELNNPYHQDTTAFVAGKAYEQPSKGENIENENVRISGAEQFRPILEYKRDLQKIKNKHALTLDPSTGNAIVDIISMVQPFAVNKQGATTLKQIADELNLSISTTKAAFLPGSTTEAIIQALENMPSSEKIKVAERITSIIKDNSSLYLNSDNNFGEMIQIQQILDGDYSKFDKLVDNVSGVLDAIGLGGAVKGSVKTLTKLFTRTKPQVERNIALRAVAGETASPISPFKVMQESNPEKARAMYHVMVKDEGDEIAEALTGTSKIDAVAEVTNPQPMTQDGSIAAKVADPGRGLRVVEADKDAVDAYNDVGGIWYTEPERKAAQVNIFNDIRSLSGLHVHDNMLSVGVIGNKASIKAMFGTAEGGFLKAQEALDQSKFALREYGVLESDLQLYKKIEGEYVPITLDEAKTADGDYLVGLDMDHKINPIDVGAMDTLDVKRNFFDRIPSLRSKKSGSLARHILDAASMLHPTITGSAAVAADRATLIDKKLLQLHSEFSDKFKQLDKVRQEKLYDNIKEANALGIEKSDFQLTSEGFTQGEIDTIKSWRKAWDTHYWFENSDLVRTLNIQGYQMFDNGTDKFFAKGIQKNSKIGNVYDPDSGMVGKLSQQELDDLYEKGGSYAALRRPVNIDGVDVEHIIVRNTPTNYLRTIRESDQVLNYRKGYYQVQYKAPKFITQVIRDSSGNEVYTKAIAVAGDSAEAEHIRQRLATTRGISLDDVKIRDDIKEMKVDTDAYWDLQNSNGRIAQRHRGKRLEDANSPPTAFDSQYILDPVESSIRAARSLSGRIASREFLETSKQRALQQYAEFFPKDKTGKPLWVEDSNSLVPTSSKYSKELADARTTVEYLNYLQHGYVNALDEGFKGLMNVMANILGESKFSKAEKAALSLGSGGPTQALKSGVFTAYLASNPLRQILIQSHQSVRMAALAPLYMTRGGMALDGAKYLQYKAGFYKNASKAEREMFDFIDNSGMLDAVDRHNLVRGSLTDLAEAASPIKRTVGKAISVPRKMGFDLGEQTNLLSHLLVVRHNAIKAGKNLSNPAVRDELYSTARALSYDMNFAGDMPYNQNAFGLFLQFLQVPHKAITSVTTNRRISVADKMKLALIDAALWGVPGATAISNLVGEDMLPENPEAREAVLFGLESVAWNSVLAKLSGKDSNVDFSAFSPYGVEGFANLFHAATTGGMAEIINNSPAFSLYLKDGSRMREALGRLMRYTGFIETQEGLEPEDALSVLSGVAEMSSGWSNYLKAKEIYETGKVKNKKGGILIEDAAWTDAAAKLFGFGSQEEVIKYAVLESIKEGTKDHENEVNQWYSDYIRVLSRTNKLSNQDDEWAVRVLGAARLMWKDDPIAMQIVNKKLSQDMLSQDMRIIRDALNYSQIPDAANRATLKNLTVLKNDEFDEANKMFDDLQNQIKAQKDD